jgi:hypothetical protein
VAYRARSRSQFSSDDPRMTSIRVRLSRVTAKKVPALALIVVGLVGMVAGVLAASVTITQTNFTAETGSYRTNSGTMTVNDQGLSIVTNASGISQSTTATFGANGSNVNLFNGHTFTAGDWMETIVFTDTAADAAQHAVTIKVVSGGQVPSGTTSLAFVTLTLTGPGAGNTTGTVTVYLDLGSATITPPVSVYISST